MKHLEPLNFCRDLRAYCQDVEGWAEPQTEQERKHLEGIRFAAATCSLAQKFILPDGGRLFHDPQIRGIDEGANLRLPFPVIALEYLATQDNYAPGMDEPCRRRIVLAIELPDQIAVTPVIRFDGQKHWHAMGTCFIPTKNFIIDRRGSAAQLAALVPNDFPKEDYYDELSALFSFLNALQCSNVHTERQPARKACKNAKEALPFDSYHTLVLDVPRNASAGCGGHGNPTDRRTAREHLRRGHIVRPEGRRPYWRNATVVNAGKTESKIGKDYAVRAAA